MIHVSIGRTLEKAATILWFMPDTVRAPGSMAKVLVVDLHFESYPVLSGFRTQPSKPSPGGPGQVFCAATQ